MADGSPETEREVLAANEAFYRAFTTQDFDGMDKLWAASATVTCIHPGWNAVRGREPVMASWQSILSNPEAPKISAAAVTLHVLGSAAYVICEEHLRGTVLIATNIFVREPGGWKMTHHQAGHLLAARVEVPPPPPPAGDRGIN
jgi:ketosteroid isomerase-like protein